MIFWKRCGPIRQGGGPINREKLYNEMDFDSEPW